MILLFIHIKIDMYIYYYFYSTMFEPYINSDFRIVPIDNLVGGKTYLIRSYVRKKYENKIGKFINLSKFSYYGYFNVKMPVNGYLKYSFNETSHFYEFIYKKDKIQNAMELRAINQILRQLIGDESFKYE